MSWVLFATPVVLIILAQWLSSVDVSGMLFGSSTYKRIRRTHQSSSDGTSPWAVAAFIVLLLVLLQYQSCFPWALAAFIVLLLVLLQYQSSFRESRLV
ncbi:hypothetical protein GQ457_10G024400 [Hibiscus cannabinus]